MFSVNGDPRELLLLLCSLVYLLLCYFLANLAIAFESKLETKWPNEPEASDKMCWTGCIAQNRMEKITNELISAIAKVNY